MLEISKFTHGSVCPPGETISDVLEEKKISFSDFANMLGGSHDLADSLIKGDARIFKTMLNPATIKVVKLS